MNRNNKETFKQLSFSKKPQYIWDYYKLPILVSVFVLFMSGSICAKNMSSKKTAYTVALANVASISELLNTSDEAFLEQLQLNPDDYQIRILEGIYLTDDPKDTQAEYAWSSRIKLSALIEKQELDAILMNKQAFDVLSAGGFLMNLEEFLLNQDSELYESLADLLAENREITNLNSPDLLSGELENQIDPANYEFIEYPMAVNISSTPLLENLDLSGDIYLGLIQNSKNLENSLAYLKLWTEKFDKSMNN